MKRNLFLTMILALIFPGLGHIYNNKFMKGLVFGFLQFLLLLLLVGTLGILGLPAIILSFYSIYDAYKIVKNNHDTIPIGPSYFIRLLIGGFLIFIYCYFIISVINEYNSPPIKESEVAVEIQNYLQEKYQKEFVVTDLDYIPATKKYVMSAYPKEDPSLEFQVSQYSYSIEVEENYLSEKWSKEAEEKYKLIIEQSFPESFDFNIHVGIKNNEMKNLSSNSLYQDLMSKNDERLYHDFTVNVIVNLDELNRDVEIKRIYNFIKYLKNNNFHDVSLDIRYLDSALKKQLNREEVTDSINENFDDFMLYRFFISRNEYETVRDSKDIENFYKFPLN